MLTVSEFGKRLLQTRDLDPVYVALAEANLEREAKARLLLAYWCFYSLGGAALIVERSTSETRFWDLMEQAALNEVGPFKGTDQRWPRSAERRHFRGKQATVAVAELRQRAKRMPGGSAGLVDWLVWMDGKDMTDHYAVVSFDNVAARVSELRGFGPWITFKIADMADRVMRRPVSFEDVSLDIYKDPRQGGALLFYESIMNGEEPSWDKWDRSKLEDSGYNLRPWDYPISHEEFEATMKKWIKHFRKFKAPPFDDRPVNVQEVETIFCKYKSYRKGHYEPGKDTIENYHGLHGWGDLATKLREPIEYLMDAYWSDKL